MNAFWVATMSGSVYTVAPTLVPVDGGVACPLVVKTTNNDGDGEMVQGGRLTGGTRVFITYGNIVMYSPREKHPTPSGANISTHGGHTFWVIGLFRSFSMANAVASEAEVLEPWDDRCSEETIEVLGWIEEDSLVRVDPWVPDDTHVSNRYLARLRGAELIAA